MQFVLLLVSCVVAAAVVDGQEKEFHNDIQLTEEETGGTLRLSSKGKLSEIVDLDSTDCVKRVLCKESKILIALKKDVPSITWKVGQLVIGSDKWQCSNNANNPDSKTIYTKVEEVKHPKEHVIELHTTSAGPLDMLEEATLQVHYDQGSHAPLRHRRYLSNPLREALNHVDWNASFISSIPFNEMGSMEKRPINVFKLKNVAEPTVDTMKDVNYDDKQFFFRCVSCHGHSQISYAFELRVKKVNNRAQVIKYMMQMELDSTIVQNYNIDTKEEITLTKYSTLTEEQSLPIFQTPIAVFKTFPPIMLRVNYATRENLELTSMMKNETHYTGNFVAKGKTVIILTPIKPLPVYEVPAIRVNTNQIDVYIYQCDMMSFAAQTYEKGQASINDVTAYNWTIDSTTEHLDTNSTTNSTFAFFQNLTISPAISWAQKDVDVNLGPPVKISIRPKVNVISTSDGTARCASSSVSVDTNVSVAETDFSVDAFGFHIWNVKLMDTLSRKMNVLHHPMMHTCRADCHRDHQINSNQTMEHACGEPGERIVRGDERFKRLQQLWGDYIWFGPEGSDNDTWCGRSGRKCLSCLRQTVGDGDTEACTTRMVHSDLASSLTRLAKYAKAEWTDRKVYVVEAWDEPTSEFPEGKHGNYSAFNDGRAAFIALTQPITSMSTPTDVQLETNSEILDRFTELAVCSNFQRVSYDTEKHLIGACVAKKSKNHVKKRSLLSRKRRSGEVHHQSVKTLLMKVGAALSSSLSSVTLPSELTVGTSYPSGVSMERACGDVTGVVSQDNNHRMERLVQYPLDDITFSPEGPANSWCGVETRRCQNCSLAVDDSGIIDHWSWCGTRTMSMRMATRLQRLAVLTNGNVVVEKALTSKLPSGLSTLYREGRAARLRTPAGSSTHLQSLTAQAKLAGFDFVKFSSPDHIEVCVKLQDGLEAQVVHFPLATLLAVPLPLEDEDEFAYPAEHAHEPRKPLLFDKTTSSNEISEHFKLHMFLSPGVRFVRLDPILINLLELAYDDFTDRFYITPDSGYRPRSINLNNIQTRPDKEKYRFEMGQAVELKPNRRVNDESLFHLGIALMKAGRTVRTQRIGIGIGTKEDRLYFHIRPLTVETEEEAIDVWNSGNTLLYRKLHSIQDEVSKGGFIITAKPDDVVCKAPIISSESFYFGFELNEGGYCWTAHDDFCSETLEKRRNISVEFQISLTSAAGSGKLPRPDIMPEIEDCIVNVCGGCPDAGDIWKQKVISCTKMILKFLSRASVPFQPLNDKVSIFNTENTASSVHSQACHDGRICVENTQIYALLLPLMTATYTRDNTEDLIFGGGDNPSPLLEIVEQELAWRAIGNVDVFIDGLRDISALRNVLKVIMILNKNVTEVTFHVDPDIDETDVTNTLQRKLEEWSSSVCPHWSRLVVTPFKVQTIPHERKRRSVVRSKDRNKMKYNMNNWEIDWILKS